MSDFYAQIRLSDMAIVAITPEELNNSDVISLELETETALKFLTGEENVSGWVCGFTNDKYSIAKVNTATHFYSRTEILQFTEVVEQKVKGADIKIVIGDGAVAIHYNGEKIKRWTAPSRFYFTREGDPSYLKCAFTLGPQILNEIVQTNFLDVWPNPVIIPIAETDDLSVYVVKSSLLISLERL